MRSLTAAALVLLSASSALAAPAAAAKTVTVTVTETPKCKATSASKAPTTTTTSTTSSSSSAPATTTSSSSIDTQEYPTATATATTKGKTGLNNYAKQIGKTYFGTAADIPGPETMDVGYMTQLNNTHDFGQLTPANYMKWEFTEPERDLFNYTGANQFVALAKANGQKIRCHNLVWYNQLPNWLTSGTWDNATLISIMENHITNLVKHFGNDCLQWDVVNEALNDDGTYREDLWYNTIGYWYLPIAYAAAAKAAPAGVKLYYNDYNIENPGPKATAAQSIVKLLQSQGIRIDGVGLQSHFIIGETPSQAAQEQNMAAFTALDIDVAVTELDVRAPTLPATLAMQEQQKMDYYSTVAACANSERCVGVTIWDFCDQYSWIPSTFPGQGYGDLWFEANNTDTLVRKSAYDGCVEALTHQVVDRREPFDVRESERWMD